MGRKKRRQNAQRRSKISAERRHRLRIAKGPKVEAYDPRKFRLGPVTRIPVPVPRADHVLVLDERTQFEDGHPLSPYRRATG